jgi:hypothetical protein
MTRFHLPLLALTFGLLTTPAGGEVIITELMYNPASPEGRAADESTGEPAQPNLVEYVELYNTGDEPVDLSGHRLTDEDGQTSAIPEGTTLDARKALVLYPSAQTEQSFRGARGPGV